MARIRLPFTDLPFKPVYAFTRLPSIYPFKLFPIYTLFPFYSYTIRFCHPFTLYPCTSNYPFTHLPSFKHLLIYRTHSKAWFTLYQFSRLPIYTFPIRLPPVSPFTCLTSVYLRPRSS